MSELYFNEYLHKTKNINRENNEPNPSCSLKEDLDFLNFNTLQTTENLPLCQQIQCISGFKKNCKCK